MKSVLGWFSPYVRSLEVRVEELAKERENLLNRLLHAYSGYELRQSVPSYAEASAANKSPEGDRVISSGTHSTIDLLKELENATLQMDAGVPDITVAAERERAQEDFEDAAKKYENDLIAARAKAAAESGHREVV